MKKYLQLIKINIQAQLNKSKIKKTLFFIEDQSQFTPSGPAG